jgi:iron complex transport system substrate-binding protein
LLPSATEILFAIGAGNDVVGVTHECDYPADALPLPKLTSTSGPAFDSPREIDRHVRAAVHGGSSLYHLNAELLDDLQPDLIVTQELCAVCAVSYDLVATAAKRLRTDPRVVSLEPASLRDVFATMEFLGEITGHADRARELIDSLEARVRTVRHDTKKQRRTLVLEWTDPPMSAGHWIPELIEIAGGTPILANPGANSQRLEWDAIAAADPDAVIVAPCGFDLSKTQHAIDDLDAIEAWRSLRAHREDHVLAMDGNAYMSRPGPRLVEATEIVAQWYTTVAEYAG